MFFCFFPLLEKWQFAVSVVIPVLVFFLSSGRPFPSFLEVGVIPPFSFWANLKKFFFTFFFFPFKKRFLNPFFTFLM